METFDFLPVAGERILTILHEPAAARGEGVLMVHAFAEEKLWTARATTRLARALADVGLTVLRFDHRGHGDSDRDHHEMRLATLVEDLDAAAARLREAGAATLHLFGFRLGGVLALLRAADLGAASVALVNPPPAGRDYLLKALRSNLTTQLSLYDGVRRDREALLADMRGTGLLNIDGYHVHRELFDELAALDLAAAPPAFAGPGLVLSLVRREGAAPDAGSRRVFEAALAGHPASRLEARAHAALWGEQKTFQTGDPALLEPLVDWFAGGWRGGAP